MCTAWCTTRQRRWLRKIAEDPDDLKSMINPAWVRSVAIGRLAPENKNKSVRRRGSKFGLYSRNTDQPLKPNKDKGISRTGPGAYPADWMSRSQFSAWAIHLAPQTLNNAIHDISNIKRHVGHEIENLVAAHKSSPVIPQRYRDPLHGIKDIVQAVWEIPTPLKLEPRQGVGDPGVLGIVALNGVNYSSWRQDILDHHNETRAQASVKAKKREIFNWFRAESEAQLKLNPAANDVRPRAECATYTLTLQFQNVAKTDWEAQKRISAVWAVVRADNLRQAGRRLMRRRDRIHGEEYNERVDARRGSRRGEPGSDGAACDPGAAGEHSAFRGGSPPYGASSVRVGLRRFAAVLPSDREMWDLPAVGKGFEIYSRSGPGM
ncbi:hypothetical protein C8J57DRAFT_1237134 [Mycena rebaudengoi]|nr:hypothetical protein C8J57DRAFT_1237134 [Mycena rebaudengoi]